MTKTFIIIAIQICLISSCANKVEEKTSEISTNVTDKIPDHQQQTLKSGCYQMVIGKDTAAMQLNIGGSHVRGKMLYKNFEKDSNHGSLEGDLIADTLKAWYKFSSEGMISIRQINFKITQEGLSEGYGEMIQQNDSAIYRYPTTLDYEDLHPFKPSDCIFLTRNFKE